LLECPYHGWAFTGAGNCDRIPQQLPDRYHARTEYCHNCRTAQKNLRIARQSIAILLLITWASSLTLALINPESSLALAAIAIGIVGLGSLTWDGLGRLLVKLKQGKRTPARNHK
jgi:hypothetical protein